MGIAHIASVHFAPVFARRLYQGAPYEMDACTLGGEPVILELQDSVQRDEGAMSLGSGGKRQQLRYLVLGEETAADLVGEWTLSGLGMNPDCRPGIWMVRERIAVMETDPENPKQKKMVLDPLTQKQVFRQATAEEKREMWEEDLAKNREADRMYAEWCWADGNRIGDLKGGLLLVPKNYKLAAGQYGLDAEWMKQASSLNSHPCPHCDKLISRTAMMCKYCAQPVDLKKWAKWQAEKEAAMLDVQTAPAKMVPPSGHGIATKSQPTV